MSIFSAHNITQKYDDVTIIEDIDLDINEGEIVCLIGSSGVGKTTLFHVLAGLIAPVSGNVILDGEDITGVTGKISYMLQKDMLLPFKNIEDNVSLPLRVRGVRKREARAEVAPYFAQFGLEGCEKKYPSELSGGMRQRAAFMRTYFFGKKVMLLDEPFSALDEITKQSMYSWYLNIAKELHLTTIFISHSLDEAITLSDRIIVMRGKPGKIVREMTIDKSDTQDFTTSTRYMEYKRELKELLR